MEFERGMPASDTNPNGEDSPIQKINEVLFLLKYNKKISIQLVFANDSIAEKKDDKDGGSPSLFKQSLFTYTRTNGLSVILVKAPGAFYEDFDSFTTLNGQLVAQFTSCEAEANKPSPYESAEEKRTRLENRSPNGKIRERKGGAVLASMETPLPLNYSDNPERVIQCLVDGDSGHPVASFVGDAAYSILELGNTV